MPIVIVTNTYLSDKATLLDFAYCVCALANEYQLG
jgi:hypothetical protein